MVAADASSSGRETPCVVCCGREQVYFWKNRNKEGGWLPRGAARTFTLSLTADGTGNEDGIERR